MKGTQKLDLVFKIIMLGTQNVGKTCFLLQFTEGTFCENYKATVGVDFKIKTISVADKAVKLTIWDTAGQERFGTLTQSHFRGAQGCICLYDVTDAQSFEKAEKYLDQAIKQYGIDSNCCILIGNKIDLEDKRAVIKEKGEKLASHFNTKFMETSAKSNEQVNDVFNLITQVLIDKCQYKINDQYVSRAYSGSDQSQPPNSNASDPTKLQPPSNTGTNKIVLDCNTHTQQAQTTVNKKKGCCSN